MNNVLFVKSLQLIAFGNNHDGRTWQEMTDSITDYDNEPEKLEVLVMGDETHSKYTITLFNQKETSSLSGDSSDILTVKPIYDRSGYSDDFKIEFSRNAVYFGEGLPKVLFCGTMLCYETSEVFRVYSHELHGKRIETGSQTINFRNDYDPTELREAFNLTTGSLDMEEMERYIVLAYARDSIIEKIFLVQCLEGAV